MFSHMCFLFQLLISYSNIFEKSLLTNFFAPFFGCTGIRFLVPFLVPLALQAGTSYTRPHISGTERVGFSKQDAFHLSPKVSEANVHWANANHTFLTHKNPQTDTFLHDISPAKLRSTARVWNPQGISKSGSSRLAQSDSGGLLCYKILHSGILNIPLPYGMHLKVSPEGRHIFKRLLGFSCT